MTTLLELELQIAEAKASQVALRLVEQSHKDGGRKVAALEAKNKRLAAKLELLGLVTKYNKLKVKV